MQRDSLKKVFNAETEHARLQSSWTKQGQGSSLSNRNVTACGHVRANSVRTVGGLQREEDQSGVCHGIAAAYDTPAEVVQGWHDSVGHCHNLMGSFAHLGVGYAQVDGSRYGSYWVQMFASPRR